MNLVEHLGKSPTVHPTAWVAPNAVLCGDVRVGENSRILFGATLTADGGPVVVGSDCIVMEGAVIRGTKRHPTRVGDHVLVGPHAYLTGCTIAREVFLATRATIFNGAVVETGAEVRINGVVHVNSRVPEDATVPIGWVAVGDPAEILPPSDHDRIWAVQKHLDFPGTVFGLKRPTAGESIMPELTRRYAAALGRHGDDRAVESSGPDPRGTMLEHPRVGVGIIIRRDDEVLLIRRKSVHGSGSWSTPGGHLDPGEALEECAAREAVEETGIEVENVRFRAITNDVFEDEEKHYLTIWMEADYRSGEPGLEAPHEMSDVAWFSWGRLPDPLFLPFKNLLDGLCYGEPDEGPRAR